MPKILIVEDDPFLLKMYNKKFQVEGFQVETAEDGISGLQKMKTFTPDLVIMDVMMPKLNGLEAVEKAKSDPATSNIPILILTNLSAATDAETAVKKGAVGFLVKSDTTPTQVITKVKTILKMS